MPLGGLLMILLQANWLPAVPGPDNYALHLRLLLFMEVPGTPICLIFFSDDGGL